MTPQIRRKLHALGSDRSGAAMVEFAISLPLLLLIAAIVIEGSRIAWTHQAASSGVRDAARFIARIAPSDICEGAVDILGYKQEVTDIVAARAGNPGDVIFPGGVTVIDVTPALNCVDVDYSTVDVPVVEVRVTLQIEFPFGGAFAFFGEPLAPLITEIADETRVYGI